MNEAGRSRRAVVEIDYGKNPDGVVHVGGRVLHQFWPLLAPHFRDILLAPQRRSGEEVIAWNWREPLEARPPQAGELAALRRRLAGDLELLRDDIEKARDGGAKLPANAGQLTAAMAAVVSGLTGRGDTELAAFVCRTEMGLRLHSWGLASAGHPTHPDESGSEGSAGTAASSATTDAGGDTPQRKRRMRVFAVLALLLMAGGVGWWVWRGEPAAKSGGEKTEKVVERKRAEPAKVATTWGETSSAVARGVATQGRRENPAPASAVDGGARKTEDVRDAKTEERAMEVMDGGTVRMESFTRKDGGARRAGANPGGSVSGADAAAGGPSGVPAGQAPDGAIPKGGGAKIGEEVGATASAAVAPVGEETKGKEAPETPTFSPGPVRGAISTVETNVVAVAGKPSTNQESADGKARGGDERAASEAGAGAGEEKRKTESQATAAPVAATVVREGADVAWAGTARLGSVEWRVRLMEDPILPTQPRLAGEEESMEALRERVLRELREKQPAALRAPMWRSGWLVTLAGGGRPRWTPPPGDEPARASVTAGRVAIGWRKGESPAVGRHALRDEAGREIARMDVAADGGVEFAFAEGVRLWLWIEVEEPAREAEMFEWRNGSGVALPTAWTRVEDGGRRLRLEVPLGPETNGVVALADRRTGWALVRRPAGAGR